MRQERTLVVKRVASKPALILDDDTMVPTSSDGRRLDRVSKEGHLC